MRYRTALLAALPTVLLFGAPLAAHATGVPFFGPIIPGTAQTCAAGWGQLAQVANNIIAFLITLLILFVTPFMVAWAGFLYVVSPANPSMRSKANSILKNTAIGVGLALGAWLIIDTFLATITFLPDPADNSKYSSTKGGVQGFTNLLFGTSGTACLIDTDKLKGGFDVSTADLSGGLTAGACSGSATLSDGSCASCTPDGGCAYSLPSGYACSGGGAFDSATGKCQSCTEEGGCDTYNPASSYATNTGTYGVSGTQCASGNTACSVSTLQAAGYSPSQANVMSCIAVTESSGDPNKLPYNIAHPGSNSTACGTFQIVSKTWRAYASGSCSDFSNCTNAECNRQTALTMISKNGYNDYTCATCNSKAQGCIDQYGGN